jgi:hypothetical protein
MPRFGFGSIREPNLRCLLQLNVSSPRNRT